MQILFTELGAACHADDKPDIIRSYLYPVKVFPEQLPPLANNARVCSWLIITGVE